MADGEVIGTWRPPHLGRRFTVFIDPWDRLTSLDRLLVNEQAERLAAHQGVALAEVAGG